jgi:hypothetical protein
MKFLIALNALGFVSFTTLAVLHALQDKWVLTTIWSLGALGWMLTGIMNYAILKLQNR